MNPAIYLSLLLLGLGAAVGWALYGVQSLPD